MPTLYPGSNPPRPRERALATAAALFYAYGVRAVGMEQIVATSGIAKTTIYRHFPTKDSLVAAFLDREDKEFWQQWDAHVEGSNDSVDQLDSLCDWIGQRVQRDGYRGCPQINVAAEFAEAGHPARIVARRHKLAMEQRLKRICASAGIDQSRQVALQIALLFDGAFMSDGRLAGIDAAHLLQAAVHRLMGDPPA